jgi:hypothetical protein
MKFLNRPFVLMHFKFLLAFLWLSLSASGQQGLVFKLNESGSSYLKVTGAAQIWLRTGPFNPGSTIFGYPRSGGSDVDIRRFRIQLFGPVSERVFFYSQLGENNFNSISDRKPSFFVHDVNGEYVLVPGKLNIGAGLNGWSGPLRFSAPSVGTIMGLDAPLYQQTTNDITDQFLRKLGIFAKGKLGILDYRVMLAQPLAFQKSAQYNPVISERSEFSSAPPHWQSNAYFQLQFLDQETNLTSYTTGTYLGKKKVFNVGFGAVFQKDAMWHYASGTKDTLHSNLTELGIDLYYDVPAGQNGEAFHFYGAYAYLNYGPQYLRNLNVLNPATGSSNPSVINGPGRGFPAYGTGSVWYAQIGYKLRDNLIGGLSLMPYFSVQAADFEALPSLMTYYSTGFTTLINGHNSKVTFAYENRPVFFKDRTDTERLSNFICQYQIFF